MAPSEGFERCDTSQESAPTKFASDLPREVRRVMMARWKNVQSSME